MQRAIHLDLKKLLVSQAVPEIATLADGLEGFEAIRGDSEEFAYQFLRPYQDPMEIDAGAAAVTWTWGVKVAGDYNGSYVFRQTAVTKTGTGASALYKFKPDLNTSKGNHLLGFDPNGFAQVTEVRCIADVATSLTGKFFKLHDKSGSVGVWIDVNNAGTAMPTTGAPRNIEITTITSNMTASQVAAAIATAVNADAQFVATNSGSIVTVTDAEIGVRTAATAETSGFAVSTWIPGSLPYTLTAVGSVDLMWELEWVIDGARGSTRWHTFRLINDLNKGTEAATLATPTPPTFDDAVFTGTLMLNIENAEDVRDQLDLGGSSNVGFDEVHAGSLWFSYAGHTLMITGSVGVPDDLTLNISVQADCTLALGANLTVYSPCELNQPLLTTSQPTFAGVRLTQAATTSALNFSSNQVQTITLSGNTTFTTNNLGAGRSKTVLITCDGTLRTLTFPAGWVFVGSAAPASIAASKRGILHVVATSGTDSGCLATWQVEP